MKILLIGELTFKEAIRKRIVLAGVLLTALFLLVYYTGVHFAFDALRAGVNRGHTPGGRGAGAEFLEFQAALFLFMGLFVANAVGALLAVFAAAGTVAAEIEQGTLQSIVTRPISRRQIILGKWLGHALMLALYLGLLFIALVLIVYSQSGWLPENIPAAAAVFIAESLVILSAALCGSAFLPTTANAVVVLMLYMTGMIGGIMEQIAVVIGKKALFATGIITSFIMPTDTLYRYTLHLLRPSPGRISPYLPAGAGDMGPFGAASPPSAWMLLYAVALAIVLIFMSVRLFSRRDL